MPVLSGVSGVLAAATVFPQSYYPPTHPDPADSRIVNGSNPTVTLPYTQTFTGTDGDPWPAEFINDGSGTTSIQGNRGRLVSDAVGIYAVTRRILNTDQIADVDLLLTFEFGTAVTNEQYLMLYARTDGAWQSTAWQPNTGYQVKFVVGLTGQADAVIQRWSGGAGGTQASAGDGTLDFSGIKKVRFQAIGGTVRFKLWLATDPEPGTWTLSYTDGAPLGAGRPGLAAVNGNSAVQRPLDVDDLVLTDGTTPATTAAGTITLGGSVSADVSASSTVGAITLGGSPSGAAVATATTGAITLGGSTTPAGSASSAGTITLGGSATGSFTAAGSITLGGSVTAQARPTAAGALTLGGAPTATASAAASGAITLSGAPTASAAAAASGVITLGGSATATQPGSNASGTITLGGTVTAGVTASATGSITLGGSPTARAGATVAGTITLGGTSTATATSSAAGSITLTGAPTARGAATTTGVITLGGTGTVQTPGSTASGSITLSGIPTASAPASVTGAIILGGTPTGRAAAATTGGVIVLGGAPTVAVAASVAGAIFLSGIANGVDGAVPLPVEFDITSTASPTLGTAAAGSPTAGVTGSSPSLAVWANSPSILLTL